MDNPNNIELFLPEALQKELSEEQIRPVGQIEGPTLVLAGAGSGKTRVLTFRILNILHSKRAAPYNIVAVTFTNKAANEMKSRLSKLLKSDHIVNQLWIATFHSLFARILRQHAEVLGFTRAYVIYDDQDQLSLLKDILKKLNIDDKLYPPKSFSERISRLKSKAILPNQTPAQKGNSIIDDHLVKVYTAYQEGLKRNNAMDFNDLLLNSYILFKDHPKILENYRELFKYILIDEYQDTNRLQYLLIHMLATPRNNLFVVGDEDQSIYRWRGADIQNILNFEKDFSNSSIYKLEENYRSTQNILLAASKLIKQNTERKEKELWTNNPTGDKISLNYLNSDNEEALTIAGKIDALNRNKNIPLSDIAIFYRTNAQSRMIEDILRSNNIPYRIYGGLRFYDRAEIKDMLSYLRILLNPKDDVSLKRIINLPARGIGKTTIEKASFKSFDLNKSLFETIEMHLNDCEISTGGKRNLGKFLNLYSQLKECSLELSPSDLLLEVFKVTGYHDHLIKQDTIESTSRIENVYELSNAIQDYEERVEAPTLEGFLEEIALISDHKNETAENKQVPGQEVSMMTLHLSKGLEFPVVFISGLEENILPHIRATQSFDTSELEEERRLLYVGMTRAQERLFLSSSQIRRNWGNYQYQIPSRFLREIPEEFLLEESSQISQNRRLGRGKEGENLTLIEGQFDNSHNKDDTKFYFESDPGPSDMDSTSENNNPINSNRYQIGQKIKHAEYGKGIIVHIEGASKNEKVTIDFTHFGAKKFVSKFLKIELY